MTWETSLADQWLRIRLAVQGKWLQFLGRKLRSSHAAGQ